MPLGSAAILARVFAAIQNMYAGDGAESKVIETTETGGARVKRKPASAANVGGRVRDLNRGGAVKKEPTEEMTRRERSEYNRLRREENAAKRRAKHGG